jgi:hypothetical protein
MIAGENGVGPKEMTGTRHSELGQGIDCRAWWSASNRELCTDTNDAEFRERARCPALNSAGRGHPLSRHRMVLMRWDQESDEHVDVEQADHY